MVLDSDFFVKKFPRAQSQRFENGARELRLKIYGLRRVVKTVSPFALRLGINGGRFAGSKIAKTIRRMFTPGNTDAAIKRRFVWRERSSQSANRSIEFHPGTVF